MGKQRRKRKSSRKTTVGPEPESAAGAPAQGKRRQKPGPEQAASAQRKKKRSQKSGQAPPKRSKKKRRREPEPEPEVAEAPPQDSVGRLAIVSLLLLALPFVPGHPLSFLPSVLYWPLYVAAVGGWWVHEARRQGWRLPPEVTSARALEIAGLLLVFGAFVLLKVIGIHASGTDENIYYYMAVRMAHGELPYRDFFFAHPPVHLVVPALVFSVTGFSVQVAKSIPIGAQLVAGACLYLALRRTSKPLALLSVLLMFTTYELLMGSTDMNGENLMTAFLMAALLAGVRKRYATSGVLAGLALGSGLYSLAAVLALGVAAAFTSRKAGARFGVGLLAAFVGVSLPFAALGGAGFFKGVFAYHFAKPVRGSDHIPVFGSPNPFTMIGALLHDVPAYLGSKGFKRTLYFQAPEYLAAALAAALLVGRAAWARSRADEADDEHEQRWQHILDPRDLLSGSGPGLAKLGLLSTLLFLIQWSALPEVYDFYMVPMFAFMALPGAWVLHEAYQGVRDTRDWAGLGVPVVLFFAFSLHRTWAASLLREMWPSEVRRQGQTVKYEWHEPAVPAWLAKPARALFFVDHRERGEVMPYYRHYVWNKSLTFSKAGEIAAYVRDNTHPDETITGASDLTPLVALLAGRRMAGDVVDTNVKRFESGMLTRSAFFDHICHDRVRYILSASRSMFGPRFMQESPFIAGFFVADRRFDDPELLHFRSYPITLYRRVDRPGLPSGMVCTATP